MKKINIKINKRTPGRPRLDTGVKRSKHIHIKTRVLTTKYLQGLADKHNLPLATYINDCFELILLGEIDLLTKLQMEGNIDEETKEIGTGSSGNGPTNKKP